MANKTIYGNLTIPLSEPNAGGVYTDLTLKLITISGGVETVAQTASVTTAKTYEFEYDDTGIDRVKVKLIRTSNSVTLAETSSRGVLPRSFKLDLIADPLYNTSFRTNNFLFDAGLSILACAGGEYFDLAKEITEGVIMAETIDGSLPFQVDHVLPNPTGSTQEFRTGTVAITAYALGYYLEQNPLAANKVQVAEALNQLLLWLLSQRMETTHDGLLTGGRGRMNGSTFDKDLEDDNAYTVDNILAYFAFKQAGYLLTDVYLEVANELQLAIKGKLFDSTNRRFYNALLSNGALSLSESLELYFMAALFFLELGDTARAQDMLDIHIELYYPVVDSINNVEAYKALTTDTKVWFEGSYAVATVYYKLGNTDKYSKIVKSLNKLLNEDGSFRWGMLKDGQYKVLDYKSVGSTAWSYIANTFPDEVFTINTGATLATGIVPVYINHTLTDTFTRETCAVDQVPGSIVFKVLPGRFNSTVSQTAVDAVATSILNGEDQEYANEHGTCSVTYTYYNTLRTGLFRSAGCPFPSTGEVYPYSIPANSFGSDISQGHAEALADAKLFVDGQEYADAMGICNIGTHIVNFWTDTNYVYDGVSNDEIYSTVRCSEALETTVIVTYEYSVNGGSTWLTGSAVNMLAGSTNSFSFHVTTVPSGSGPSVVVRIVDVSPDAYGSQLYQWNNNVTVFSNEERSAYFIRNNCGSNGINANSVLEFVCAPGLFTSHISQDYANAMADAYVAATGQGWVNANAICAGVTYHPNQVQSQTFQKQGCGSGYEGTYVAYIIPAGTYTSTVSIPDANNLALADIAANGQNYANTNGYCELSNDSIGLNTSIRVDQFGLYDEVFMRVRASSPVTDNLLVRFTYNFNGNVFTHNFNDIYVGETISQEVYVGSFPPGEGYYVSLFIDYVSPNPGGKYLF